MPFRASRCGLSSASADWSSSRLHLPRRLLRFPRAMVAPCVRHADRLRDLVRGPAQAVGQMIQVAAVTLPSQAWCELRQRHPPPPGCPLPARLFCSSKALANGRRDHEETQLPIVRDVPGRPFRRESIRSHSIRRHETDAMSACPEQWPATTPPPPASPPRRASSRPPLWRRPRGSRRVAHRRR